VGSLTVDGVKMSKSLGNFIRVKDALEKHRAEAIRMFAMSAHYSSPVDYSDAALEAATGGWERLYTPVRMARQMMGAAPDSDDGSGILARLDQARDDFNTAMDDDFNAPKAIGALQELTREVNTLLNSGAAVGKSVLAAIDTTYRDLGGEVLGVIPDVDASAGNGQREGGLIELLIDLRKQARKNKNFAESDRIRDELARLGVTLEDRADGTIWRAN
jgi:cysteinyl-tRNA synthetase